MLIIMWTLNLIIIFITTTCAQQVIKIGIASTADDTFNSTQMALPYFRACAKYRQADVTLEVVPIDLDKVDADEKLAEELISQNVSAILGSYNADLEESVARTIPYIVLDPQFYDLVNVNRTQSSVHVRIKRSRAEHVITLLPVLAALTEPLRKYVYARVRRQSGYGQMVVIAENAADYEEFVDNQMHAGADTLVMPFIIPAQASWNDSRRILAAVRHEGSPVIFLHSHDLKYITKIFQTAMSLDMMSYLYDWVLTYIDMDGLRSSLSDSLLKNCSSVIGLQLVDRQMFTDRGLDQPTDQTNIESATLLDALDIIILAYKNNSNTGPFTYDEMWEYLRNFPVSYTGSLGNYGEVLQVTGEGKMRFYSESRAFIRVGGDVKWKEYRSCNYSQVYQSQFVLVVDEEAGLLQSEIVIPPVEADNATDRLSMPLFNLQPVKVAVAMAPPFVFETIDEDGKRSYSGLMIDYLNLYADMLNFTVKYEYADMDVGSFKNGKWSGSISHLVDEKVSIAVGGISVNTERSQYVEFTVTTFPGMLSTLMKRPEIKSTPWQFLYPFSKYVWMSILVVFVIISALLILIDRYDDDDNFTKRESCYYVASILLSGSTDTNPISTPSRVLIGCFMFFSIVVFQSYVANMAAFLTTRDDFDDIPTSVSDLIAQNRMKLGTVGEAAGIIRHSKKEPLLGLNSKLLEYDNPIYVNHDEAIEDLRASSFGERALILVSSTTQYYANKYCDVMYMHHNSDTLMYSLALPKGSQLKTVFDSVITNVREVGKDLEIIDRWYNYDTECENTGAEAYTANLENTPLTVEEMVGVFLVLLIGIGVATAVGVAGELWRRFYAHRHRDQDGTEITA